MSDAHFSHGNGTTIVQSGKQSECSFPALYYQLPGHISTRVSEVMRTICFVEFLLNGSQHKKQTQVKTDEDNVARFGIQ